MAKSLILAEFSYITEGKFIALLCVCVRACMHACVRASGCVYILRPRSTATAVTSPVKDTILHVQSIEQKRYTEANLTYKSKLILMQKTHQPINHFMEYPEPENIEISAKNC